MDSLKFVKIFEKTVLPKVASYFSIRKYSYQGLNENSDCTDILSGFIKTKHFLWKEEFRDKVQGSINGKDIYTDWNFHGLYDIKKMSLSSFDNITYPEFVKRLTAFIEKEINSDMTAGEIYELIGTLNGPNNSYYIIKNLPDEFKHEWSVYEFFISGLICDKENQIITLVEFGLD